MPGRWRMRRRGWGYGSLYDYDERGYSRDWFSIWIEKTLRRRKALNKAKKFVIKKGRSLIIKNNNVMVIYHTDKRSIVCIDVHNRNSVTASPNDYELKISDAPEDLNDRFDSFFDTLCTSFDIFSNYAGVSNQIKKNFPVKEQKASTTKKVDEPQNKQINSLKTRQININEATESQLVNLPGISIVQAKKIINRINLKGDFNSIEEFFTEMKVKSHFQDKLREMIFASPYKVAKNKNGDEDRLIDL